MEKKLQTPLLTIIRVIKAHAYLLCTHRIRVTPGSVQREQRPIQSMPGGPREPASVTLTRAGIFAGVRRVSPGGYGTTRARPALSLSPGIAADPLRRHRTLPHSAHE
jgi:hypothetical protein